MTKRAESSSKPPPVESRARARAHRPLPLLPACLVPIFRRPFNAFPDIIPSDLTRVRYCRQLKAPARERLAGLILGRVRQAIASGRLPASPLKLQLPEDFGKLVQNWPSRVRDYISRLDLVARPSLALRISPRDFAELVPHSAAEVFIDVLLRLEAWGTKVASGDMPGPGASLARRLPGHIDAVYSELKQLEHATEAILIRREDPRLLEVWPDFAVNADTLEDLLGLVLTCEAPCFMPDGDLSHLLACRPLLATIHELQNGSVESEIRSVAAPLARLCCPDLPGAAAQAFVEFTVGLPGDSPIGLSRRKARDLYAQMWRQLRVTRLWLPATGRFAEYLKTASPENHEAKRLLGPGLSVERAIHFASAALPTNQVLVAVNDRGNPSSSAGDERHFEIVRRIARVHAWRHGLANVEALAREASLYCGEELRREQVHAIVDTTRGAHWLSEREGWFAFHGPNRLCRHLTKGLVVAGRPLRLPELFRHWAPRSRTSELLPLKYVARLCQRVGGMRVDERGLVALSGVRRPKDVLSAAETRIYQYIQSKGGLVRADELRAFAACGDSVQAAAAVAVVEANQMVEQLEGGLCHLRGRPIRPAKLARARASRRHAAHS